MHYISNTPVYFLNVFSKSTYKFSNSFFFSWTWQLYDRILCQSRGHCRLWKTLYTEEKIPCVTSNWVQQCDERAHRPGRHTWYLYKIGISKGPIIYLHLWKIKAFKEMYVSSEFETSVYIMTETCFFNELSDCTLDVSKQWQ